MTNHTTIQVSLSQTLKGQLCQYLKAYTKFSTILSISIAASSNILFSVVNENSSCYSSLCLHASRLQNQIPTNHDANDSIFLQAYRQPLKPFLHFLLRSASATSPLVLEFTPFSLSFRMELCEGLQAVWQSVLTPGPIQNPIYGPLQAFPASISGFSVDWFHYLMEGVSNSTLLTKSTLILKVSPINGLRLVLPGKNQAEIEVGPFNFGEFHTNQEFSISVSLREIATLMSLAATLNSLIDFYFGPTGCPLVAILSSIGSFECKFIMATMHVENNHNDEIITDNVEEEDHVSGTDDEQA